MGPIYISPSGCPKTLFLALEEGGGKVYSASLCNFYTFSLLKFRLLTKHSKPFSLIPLYHPLAEAQMQHPLIILGRGKGKTGHNTARSRNG